MQNNTYIFLQNSAKETVLAIRNKLLRNLKAVIAPAWLCL